MTDESAKPRFIADHMLGSLAKWLRMIGYDTVYDKKLDDPAIAATARAENRFVLTRDKELSKEPGALFIESDELDAQLSAVRERFGLAFDEAAIRCTACNGELVDMPKEEAKGSVPEGAFAGNDRFWKCAGCGKVYWRGSHWRGITERLKKLNLA
ncbi:MAG: Mut7-C RNAse domain-containing protein [Candidatus Thermoplasmatota archaeon]